MSHLQKLKIPSNKFKDDALNLIMDYMTENYMRCSSLTKLNIGNNNFNPKAIAGFLLTLGRKRFPLKSLQLCFNIFDKGEFKMIAKALKLTTQLEKLYLRGCNLCLDDLDLINDALKCSPSSLKAVYVSVNRIT